MAWIEKARSVGYIAIAGASTARKSQTIRSACEARRARSRSAWNAAAQTPAPASAARSGPVGTDEPRTSTTAIAAPRIQAGAVTIAWLRRVVRRQGAGRRAMATASQITEACSSTSPKASARRPTLSGCSEKWSRSNGVACVSAPSARAYAQSRNPAAAPARRYAGPRSAAARARETMSRPGRRAIAARLTRSKISHASAHASSASSSRSAGQASAAWRSGGRQGAAANHTTARTITRASARPAEAATKVRKSRARRRRSRSGPAAKSTVSATTARMQVIWSWRHRARVAAMADLARVARARGVPSAAKIVKGYAEPSGGGLDPDGTWMVAGPARVGSVKVSPGPDIPGKSPSVSSATMVARRSPPGRSGAGSGSSRTRRGPGAPGRRKSEADCVRRSRGSSETRPAHASGEPSAR